MAEMGYISYEQAASTRRRCRSSPTCRSTSATAVPKGFLLKMVEAELAAAGFDPSQICGGGLKIITTFDKKSQDAAVEVRPEVHQAGRRRRPGRRRQAARGDRVGRGRHRRGARHVRRPRLRQELAELGHHATTDRVDVQDVRGRGRPEGRLQPASRSSTATPGPRQGDSTPVRNEFSYQYGPVTLLKATADSINTAFVDLTTQMDNGPNKVMEAAQAAGAPKGAGWDDNDRIALGTAEVSPLNQANAYATFANDGTYGPRPRGHGGARTAQGKVVYKADPGEARGGQQGHRARRDVRARGRGRAGDRAPRCVPWTVPIAGKTGTKDVGDEIVSAWFVAYTKQISTAVMYVAGDGGNADLDKYQAARRRTFFGGDLSGADLGDVHEDRHRRACRSRSSPSRRT